VRDDRCCQVTGAHRSGGLPYTLATPHRHCAMFCNRCDLRSPITPREGFPRQSWDRKTGSSGRSFQWNRHHPGECHDIAAESPSRIGQRPAGTKGHRRLTQVNGRPSRNLHHCVLLTVKLRMHCIRLRSSRILIRKFRFEFPRYLKV
jgi:hypothetical protein